MIPLLALLVAQWLGPDAPPFVAPTISQLPPYQCTGTGCVSRTIADSLTDVVGVSVKSFGAHSNTEAGFSTFDSSAAFTAAFAASSQVYVPPGRYHVDSATLSSGNITVIGAGESKTILWNDQGTPVFALSGTINSDPVFGDIITIRGLRFELTNNSGAFAISRHSGDGVVAGLAHINFDHNVVYSADGGYGLNLIGVISGDIHDNIFYGTSVGYTSTFDAIVMNTVQDSYDLNVNINNNTFTSIRTAVSATALPLYWFHNAGHRIENNLMIGLTGYGFYGTYLDTITIQNNMMDYTGCGNHGETATAVIYADSVQRLYVTGNPWLASRYTCPVIQVLASTTVGIDIEEVQIFGNKIRNVSYGGAGSSGITFNTSNATINFFQVSHNDINLAQTAISLNATGSVVINNCNLLGNTFRGAANGITFGAQLTGCRAAENMFESTVTTPIGGAGFGNVSFGVNTFSNSPSNWPHTLTYSASMTPNGLTSDKEVITATNNTAFTINAPTNVPNGGTLTFYIKNTSGGALGVATWAAQYKLAGAWTQPATGNGRTITFVASGGLWQELSRAAADLPN